VTEMPWFCQVAAIVLPLIPLIVLLEDIPFFTFPPSVFPQGKSNMAKVLFIERNQNVGADLRNSMMAESHALDLVSEVSDLLNRLKLFEYDLVLVELEMATENESALLQSIRSEGLNSAVIVFTQEAITPETKADILDAGADDCITAPFFMTELNARIRSILRRSAKQPAEVYQVGDVVLDRTKHQVLKNGQEIVLAPKEFSLLELLMSNPGQIHSGESLLRELWASTTGVTIEAVRTSVKRLRQKLSADDNSITVIETVAKLGYRINCTTDPIPFRPIPRHTIPVQTPVHTNGFVTAP